MPIYYHENFIPLESDAILWRYMDLAKFKSLLETKSLFFCRQDKFIDHFEGSVPRKEAAHRMGSMKRASQALGSTFNEEQADKNIKGTQFTHKKLKRATIINCWHINENESDAMWRLYLKDNEGVAIQTTGNRILKTIDGATEMIGQSKVRYIDYENGTWYHPAEYPHKSYNYYIPLVHKRNEFKHENEFRLFTDIQEAGQDENYWDKQPNHIGKFISVDLEILIEKIYLPPVVDEKFSSLIRQLISEFGYTFEIAQSKLSSEAIY